jgi:hypothetical protein
MIKYTCDICHVQASDISNMNIINIDDVSTRVLCNSCTMKYFKTIFENPIVGPNHIFHVLHNEAVGEERKREEYKNEN